MQHRWYLNGNLLQNVDLRIAANPGEGYRMYSRMTVAAERRGNWTIELRDAGERSSTRSASSFPTGLTGRQAESSLPRKLASSERGKKTLRGKEASPLLVGLSAASLLADYWTSTPDSPSTKLSSSGAAFCSAVVCTTAFGFGLAAFCFRRLGLLFRLGAALAATVVWTGSLTISFAGAAFCFDAARFRALLSLASAFAARFAAFEFAVLAASATSRACCATLLVVLNSFLAFLSAVLACLDASSAASAFRDASLCARSATRTRSLVFFTADSLSLPFISLELPTLLGHFLGPKGERGEVE